MGLVDSFLRPSSDKLAIVSFHSGKYIQGRWDEGKPAIRYLRASLQPMKAREIQQLPEARRTSEAVKIYVETPISTQDVIALKSAERVCFKGVDYEVHQVEDWTDTDLPHYKVIALKVDAHRAKREAR